MIRADLSSLANHLWQSAFCVFVAWAFTLAFRKNRAAVRYCLWLAASMKFLIPFSLLIAIGGQLGWRSVPPPSVAPPQWSVPMVMNAISEPFPVAAPASRGIATASSDAVPAILFGVWLSGVAVSILLWLRCWRQIRNARQTATALPMEFPIPVLSSRARLEPGVVGILTPVLLLPHGITEHLAPDQMEAILAHELCHVQRRDNLTAALHIVVETIFWFFPLVWWVRARLVEERERACDEEVLRLGSEPRAYAEGILNICKGYLEYRLPCVSGVTGSDLKTRIQAILAARVPPDLSFARRAALAAAGIAAVAVPFIAGIVGTPRIHAQSQFARPAPGPVSKFESVSIQSCTAVRGASSRDFPGTLLSECTTAERMIWQAYGPFVTGRMDPLSTATVAGGPAWLRSDLYDIEAKTRTPQIQAMMNGPMLQAVLEDRFQLKVHREVRDIPVYVLTVARGGPRLQPFQGTCVPRDWDHPTPEPRCETPRLTVNGLDFSGANMADLRLFFLIALDRPVIDRTGLTGRFDIHLEVPTDFSRRPVGLFDHSDPAAPPVEPSVISATRSAVQKLGLNLEPASGPGEFIVIDHVEKPSGN